MADQFLRAVKVTCFMPPFRQEVTLHSVYPFQGCNAPMEGCVRLRLMYKFHVGSEAGDSVDDAKNETDT